MKKNKGEKRAARRTEFQQRLLLGGLQNGILPLPGPFEIIPIGADPLDLQPAAPLGNR
jgi:hypothetical protein